MPTSPVIRTSDSSDSCTLKDVCWVHEVSNENNGIESGCREENVSFTTLWPSHRVLTNLIWSHIAKASSREWLENTQLAREQEGLEDDIHNT